MVGDVVGSPLPDLLLGDDGADGFVQYPGGLAVWAGSAGGFAAAPSGQLAGSGEGFGDVVAVVGDVDGDGVNDVATSAEGDEVGAETNEGLVLVWPSGAGGLQGAPVTLEGDGAWDYLGGALAGGDFDGDGHADVAATGEGIGVDGRADVFPGSPAGPDPVPSWSYSPLGETAAVPSVLVSGDVNRDGFDDLLIGSAYWSPPSGGIARLFAGGPRGLSAAPVWTRSGTGFYGITAAVTDLDGDGFPEVVVGASSYDGVQCAAGRIEVFRGSAAGPSVQPTWSLDGERPVHGLGYVVAGGDVDGDGYGDLLALAPGGQHVSCGDGGPAEVVGWYGGPTGISATPSFRWRPDLPYPRSLAVADLDGDGDDDVLVGGGIVARELWRIDGGPDADRDGAADAVDCAPADPTVFPGEEVWYDGIDGDCAGGDDFDADADGVRPAPWGPDGDDAAPTVTMTLSMAGTCPTAMDVELVGATPNGLVEVWSGTSVGEFLITDPRHPCAPIPAGIGSPRRVGVWAADAAGVVRGAGLTSALRACERTFQAVDLSTCGTSDAVAAP